MRKLLLALSFAITTSNIYANTEIKLLRVYKSDRRLELIGSENKVLKTYRIMLGRNPVGAKTQEGDNKTPEGTYELDYKNAQSKFHKALHISYPTAKQKLQAKLRGVSAGGDIMLHGLPNDFKEMTIFLNSIGLGDIGDDLIRMALPNFDWTNGCIAVTDAEIDEIYAMVSVPTKITIEP